MPLVAQWSERRLDKPEVAGSTPARGIRVNLSARAGRVSLVLAMGRLLSGGEARTCAGLALCT